MPDVYQLSDTYRAALLDRDRSAVTRLVVAYSEVYARVHAAALALAQQAEAARTQGKFSSSWLVRQRRLQSLQAQILDEVHHFARFADQVVVDEQRRAVYDALGHARQLTLAALGPLPAGAVDWNRLPREAAENLIGVLGDGSPLRSLFATLAPQASGEIGQALTFGLTTGQHPRTISREIKAASGVSLTRALTISRSAVLFSYREAARQSYQNNSDVVKAWKWCSAKGLRTCPVCLAMDGKEFPLDEFFPAHLNCRCSLLPVTKSWEELGFQGVREVTPERETGSEWFEGQSAEVKQQVLGKAAYAAYERGEVGLGDFAGVNIHPQWGKSVYTRSLKDAIEAHS